MMKWKLYNYRRMVVILALQNHFLYCSKFVTSYVLHNSTDNFFKLGIISFIQGGFCHWLSPLLAFVLLTLPRYHNTCIWLNEYELAINHPRGGVVWAVKTSIGRRTKYHKRIHCRNLACHLPSSQQLYHPLSCYTPNLLQFIPSTCASSSPCTLSQSLQACSSGLSTSSDETPPQPHPWQWTGQPSCWGAEGSNGGHTQHHLPGTPISS